MLISNERISNIQSSDDQPSHFQKSDRETLVKLDGVSKKFCRSLKKSLWYGIQDILSEVVGHSTEHTLRTDEFWAVQDVSFDLKRGDCLGLVGNNGAGKSTLLKMITGLIKPDRGIIEINGTLGGLIALGAGFNPVLSGRENVYINGSVLGLHKREIDQRFEEIVDFAELNSYIDAPVQSYSSGMQVRLGFATAAILLKPDVLILDEVLAVGDRAFRAKCMLKVTELLDDSAVIFVSHQENLVQRICNRAIWLEKGTMKQSGEVESVLSSYTNEQFSSFPQLQSKLQHNGYVSQIEVTSLTPAIQSGQDLRLSVQLTLSHPETIEGIRIVITDRQKTLVARTEISCHLDFQANIKQGLNLSVKNLLLGHGHYDVIFVGLSKGGKKEIFTLIDACSFLVQSDIIGHCIYLPEGELQQDLNNQMLSIPLN